MRQPLRYASKSWRFNLVILFFIIFIILIISKLFWLMILDTQGMNWGDQTSIRKEITKAHRGRILDRHGNPLAISTLVTALGLRRNILEKNNDWAYLLGKAAEIPADRLLNRVKKTETNFIYASRYLTPEKAAAVRALNIPGVELKEQFRRFYPAGEVVSHLVGFTDVEDEGQEGLEVSYQVHLSGVDGSRTVLTNNLKQGIRYVSDGNEVRHGRDLNLSIDLQVQYLAYRALKEAVLDSGAKAGSVVLLDGITGEVLALASQPSFNPNDTEERLPPLVRNRPVSDLMEPGSPIKPFTIAAAMDFGSVDMSTLIQTSPGRFKIDCKVIKDIKNYGELDLDGIIKKSSNIGAAKIALTIDPHRFLEKLNLLGLGKSTGSGLISEAEGHLPGLVKWSECDRAALSFGYSLNITPLQLAQAYSVFVNEGLMQPITLFLGGEERPKVSVFSKETAIAVKSMLHSVTKTGGTGQKARVPDFHVGGKTGTTMKSIEGSYASRSYWSSFVGIAPVENPRFVMVVVIDDPQVDVYYGGAVAAPVFSKVMDRVLQIYGISPDNLVTKRNRARNDES